MHMTVGDLVEGISSVGPKNGERKKSQIQADVWSSW